MLLLLTLLAAFSFGAIVTTAFAVSYHTSCVGHGFVAGSSQTDNSFFSRVEAGCNSSYRQCAVYTSGALDGAQQVYGTTATCNAYSFDFGSFTECASTAHISDPGVFEDHYHTAPNWCG